MNTNGVVYATSAVADEHAVDVELETPRGPLALGRVGLSGWLELEPQLVLARRELGISEATLQQFAADVVVGVAEPAVLDVER